MTQAITDELIAKVQSGSEKMTQTKAIALAGELYKRGKYQQAANVCRQIIEHKPALPDPHNILGVSLNALGKPKESITSIKRAIKLAPRTASYHANLGEIYRVQGNLADGLLALREAVRLDPKNAQAHNNLGIICYERKEYDEAIDCYRLALELNPNFPEAYNNLGNVLRLKADRQGAREAYQNALAYREQYPEAYNNLGTLLREENKTDQAKHALKKAISQNPRYIDAYNNLAAIHFAENQEVEALRQMSEVFRFAPRDAKSLALTARIQVKRGNLAAAERACKIILEDNPSNSEAMTILGNIMHELDRYEDAIGYLEKALEFDSKNAEARNFYGVALKSVGRFDDARREILAALELNGQLYGAYANLNDLVDFSKEKDLFKRIETLMEEFEDPNSERSLPLHYAYAKALDDVGQHEKALEHYILGGELKRARLNYDEKEAFDFFENIKKTFPAEIFASPPYKGIDTDRLVFIVGMPRSGSTLVEQIISHHPDVFGAGEVKYLSDALHAMRDRFPSLSTYPDMVCEMSENHFQMLTDKYMTDISSKAGNAKRITDKLLTNFFFVGLLHILFPNAKFINTRRNPVDTCLSTFTKLFKDDMPHSYDLGEIGRYYRQYEGVMAHWNEVLPKGVLTTIEYEEVVNDTENQARKLIDFVGLPWNPACLAFHESTRPVKTASVAQVRKPIYKTAMDRWKKYGPGLQPLIDALGLEVEKKPAK